MEFFLCWILECKVVGWLFEDKGFGELILGWGIYIMLFGL